MKKQLNQISAFNKKNLLILFTKSNTVNNNSSKLYAPTVKGLEAEPTSRGESRAQNRPLGLFGFVKMRLS